MKRELVAARSIVRCSVASYCTAGLLIALVISGCAGSAGRQASEPAAQPRSRGLPPHVFRVPSGSMEPTLPIGSRVVVGARAPFVGAIVVNDPPEDAEQQLCGPKPHEVKPGGAPCDMSIPTRSNTHFVKRIVAGPGDEIYVRAGHVYRMTSGASRFVRERDPYAALCGDSPECDFPDPIKIPVGR
jgi:signal peptidase I